MSDYKLSPDKPIDVAEILKDLENYRPRRRGWTWRKPVENLHMGPFVYHDCTEPLKSSVPLPPAHYFENIDPQPAPVITTEIASGRFEDDIRRMRMAAHHGADHIMVIRTAGQSHFDGLIEGTPQGMGGVPITRKQVRAQRKALDMIEDEVGRPINYHSYVSGVAGPDIAVMFAEEGVNGVHQDPQYNVIYRNINMIRSFVDACESKKLIAWAGMAQIDGAHNANATAREAWKVMPELMVQHGINAIFSARVGINKKNICLSTVPPTATPAPCVYMDLPYAVALRDLFHEYRMRAQMNTKYIESSTREATVTHVLNMFISKLTSADIQSTITPDEGRNVPWHIYNIEACDTAKQTLVGLDGLMEMVELKDSGYLREKARELKERAILFMEEMLELGGYFNAVEEGFFVDSGIYPERNGDGIARKSTAASVPEQFSSAKLTTWLPSPHTTATTTLSSTIPILSTIPPHSSAAARLNAPKRSSILMNWTKPTTAMSVWKKSKISLQAASRFVLKWNGLQTALSCSPCSSPHPSPLRKRLHLNVQSA